jgi:dTMP kinase
MPLIVFEGIDGCGKSTQVELLTKRLAQAGVKHRTLREPGGTALGEAARRILLDPATHACPTAELFGYLQARAQLCDEVLIPALAAHETVVLDRFYHSTIAYQAYGLSLDLARVRAAIDLAVGGVRPDVVLWLNVDPAIAAKRRAAAKPDRIEARGLPYMRRVHAGFETLAKAGELMAVDGTLPSDRIAAAIWEKVSHLLPRGA